MGPISGDFRNLSVKDWGKIFFDRRIGERLRERKLGLFFRDCRHGCVVVRLFAGRERRGELMWCPPWVIG